MKHIKRKFTIQVKLPKGAVDKINEVGTKVSSPHEVLNSNHVPEGFVAWFLTDQDYMIKTFKYDFKHSKNPLFIPEPDPVLIYFNNAQINLRLIEQLGSRKNLIESLKAVKDATAIMHNLYNFMAHSTSFAVFAFMALECLVNKVIPDDFSLRNEMRMKTEEYNIHQIQQMEFLKKIKDILPEVTKKYFWKDYPTEYQNIIDLKNFRNEVAHTKKQVKDETYYRQLFITALDFDYTNTLMAVKTFINYYCDRLVEECDCGRDF